MIAKAGTPTVFVYGVGGTGDVVVVLCSLPQSPRRSELRTRGPSQEQDDVRIMLDHD